MAEMGHLTVTAVKNALEGKHFDGGGLFLLVKPNGGRYWRLKYRMQARRRCSRLASFRK